jgi:hypothetical protein
VFSDHLSFHCTRRRPAVRNTKPEDSETEQQQQAKNGQLSKFAERHLMSEFLLKCMDLGWPCVSIDLEFQNNTIVRYAFCFVLFVCLLVCFVLFFFFFSLDLRIAY